MKRNTKSWNKIYLVNLSVCVRQLCPPILLFLSLLWEESGYVDKILCKALKYIFDTQQNCKDLRTKMEELSSHLQGTTTKFRKIKEKKVIPCTESVSLCQSICFYSWKMTCIAVILPTKIILNLEVHCATSMTGCKRKMWTSDWRLVYTNLTNLFFLLYIETQCLFHWSKDFIMTFIANFYH